MRKFAFIMLLFATFFFAISKAEEKRVQCEGIGNFGGLKTCLMGGNTTIDLEGFLISSPEDHEMQQLYMGHNRKIFFLPENIHDKYPNIQKIQADWCPIKSISSGVFDNLIALKELHLYAIKIKIVGENTFKGLTQLKTLSLGNNRIKRIENNLFEDLKSLENLYLADNQIKIFGENTFKGLTQLKTLSLGNNQIEKIENNLFEDLKSLESLNFDGNKIKIVDENAFKGLTQLKSLDLRSNQIEKVENNLFEDLKSLETLVLTLNKIKIVGENAFKGLTQLKTLELNKNQIEKIENNLFEDLKSLEALRLYGNKIKIVGENAFKGLTQLKTLSLGTNQIEKIENNLFEDLKSLELLWLNDNKIKFLNGKIFSSMKNLRYADLSGNVCINKQFSFIKETSELIEIVSNQCGFKDVSDFDCGKVSSVVGLIIKGRVTNYWQWPFLVSLKNVESNSHFCGGSLISNQHVLTAAHCLQYKEQKEKLPVSKMIVNLGKYNLSATNEPNAVARNVKAYHIHPDWNLTDTKWDADLAILLLEEPVEFSDIIEPVCLPQNWEIFRTIEEGIAVGWGESEFASRDRPSEDIPRQVGLKVVSGEYCYTTDFEIARISTLRTFCAGGNGTGPCRGDSGGGLYTKIRGNWTLRGIVSASVINYDGSCNVDTFTVYTKVSEYYEWIRYTATVADNS